MAFAAPECCYFFAGSNLGLPPLCQNSALQVAHATNGEGFSPRPQFNLLAIAKLSVMIGVMLKRCRTRSTYAKSS